MNLPSLKKITIQIPKSPGRHINVTSTVLLLLTFEIDVCLQSNYAVVIDYGGGKVFMN